MSRLAPRFSSHRMVREYVEKVYVPAAAAYRRRAEQGAAAAADLEAWNARLRDDWRGLRFVDVRAEPVGDQWHVQAQVYLGDLPPDSVRLELYSDHTGGEVFVMAKDGPIPGAVNGFRYFADVPAVRPLDHYTPRVVPFHESALLPIEAPQVFWQR
jgi:starch phosphorylase